MLLYPSESIERKFPENYKEGELDFCKSEFKYNTNNVQLLDFKNCYVRFNGYLYDSGYKIVEGSLIDIAKYRPTSLFIHYKKLVLKRKRRLNRNQTYLLAFDEWSSNHYHWITEVLPRLIVVADQLPQYILLLPDVPYIRNVGVKLLEYAGLKPLGIEWIQQKEIIKVPNLKLITAVILSGRIHDALLKQVQNRFLSLPLLAQAPPATRRIYITRANATNRRVLNEDEVVAVLKQYDFDIVAFEGLSIEEQIKMANSASIMVAIHGAGLANAIFMQRDTSVLEFRRDKVYHNQCYWHLSSSIGQKFYYLFGQPDNDHVIEGLDACNLTIPIKRLQVTIAQMIKDEQSK
jgi:hypothetical protein